MNLLEMTLQGGVLILVILLLRGLLRYRLPGWTFRILWGVALVRLLVPLTLPSQWSVYTGLDRLADRAETVQTAPAPQPGPSVIWTAPSEEPSHSDVPAAPSEPVPAPVPEGAAQTVPVKVPWHIVLWGTGAGLLALAFAVSYGRNVAVFRTALPLTHPAINRWRQCYPVLRGVPIRRCDRIRSPLTYGLVRPVVLLPKGLDCDDTQELGYVLLHEGAHIRHRDAWWKLFLAAALCVHWFNPLVWCMYVCANRDLERCCDESVVRTCGLKARSEYALTLLKWEERRSGLLPLCSPFSNRIMKERVTFIMKLKQQSAAALALAAVLVLGTTVAFATGPAPEPAENTPVSQGTQTQTPGAASPESSAKPNTIVAAAGVKPELDSPSAQEEPASAEAPQETAPPVQTAASRYPRNQSGQTYGVWTPADGYGDVPDLIYFCWDEATAGYLLRSDLYPYSYPLETQEQKAAYVTWYIEKFGHLQGRTNMGSCVWSTPLLDQEGNELPDFHQGINLELYDCTLSEAELWGRLESGNPPRPFLPCSSVPPETIPAGQRVASNLTPEEAANPPQEVAQQLVNGDYPRNSKGETYGSMTLSDYTGYRPDLIAVGTTEGGSGYVTYEDWEDGGYLGYPGDRNNLGEAYEEWCRNMPTDYLIPVYDVEHEQVVGQFSIYNQDGYDRTQESIEEEIQMVTDMMENQGFSQQEVDEYIQQLRERYAQ